MCPSSRTTDDGASGGTANEVSPTRIVLSGVAAEIAAGLMMPSRGARAGEAATPSHAITWELRMTAWA